MRQGWVYILKNEGMPGLIKIGFTQNLPQERARELYSSGVAFPFEVVYQACCYDYQEVEREVHDYLSDRRVNDGREFFACPVHEAVKAIEFCAGDRFISAQDFRKQTIRTFNAAERPSENKTEPDTALKGRHFLLGAAVFAGLAGAVWWLFFSGNPSDSAESSNLRPGYEYAGLGREDVNLRACPSRDCGIVSVLPSKQKIMVKTDSQTATNWLYAEFHGKVCYVHHYTREKGCSLWSENNIVEGWVHASALLQPEQNKRSGVKQKDDGFDSLF